jgi:hypothetical protein
MTDIPKAPVGSSLFSWEPGGEELGAGRRTAALENTVQTSKNTKHGKGGGVAEGDVAEGGGGERTTEHYVGGELVGKNPADELGAAVA